MRRKLNLGFLAIILLLWAIFVFIALNIRSKQEILVELKDNIVPGAIAMTEMDGRANQIAHRTMEYILTGDAGAKQQARTASGLLDNSLAAHKEHETHIGDPEKKEAEKLEEKGKELISVANEIINLKQQGVSTEVLLKKNEELHGALYPFVEHVISHKAEHLEELAAAETKAHSKHGPSIIIILSLAATLLALSIALFVDRLFVRSIIESKHTEEALRQSMTLLQHIADHLPVMFSYVDSDRSYVFANRQFEDSFGPGTVVGKTVQEVLSPEIYQEVKPRVDTVLAGKAVDYERIGLTGKGDKRCFLVSYRPDKDESGNVKGLFALLWDITEIKQKEQALRESEAQKKAILDASIDRIRLVDKDMNILWANKTTVKELNVAPEDIVGQPCYKILQDRNAPCDECPTKKALESGNTEHAVIHQRKSKGIQGETYWDGYAVPIKNESGDIVDLIQITRNVTESKRAEEKIKASLKEKEVLLKEIHHRVKNNLQVVSSLLNLQSRYVKDRQALEMFKESQNRVRSMALIHEKLYQSEDLARIDIAGYIQDLTTSLYRSYGTSAAAIKLNIDVRDILLDINTSIPCGLIINELVSNSLKHAFPDGREGEIKIAMHHINENRIELIVSDTGRGFPEDIDFRTTESFGMQVVLTLVEQIDGTIELDTSKGTEFKITFGEPKYKKRM